MWIFVCVSFYHLSYLYVLHYHSFVLSDLSLDCLFWCSVFFMFRRFAMVTSVTKKRKYSEEYINYGFTSILADDIEKSQCTVLQSAGERFYEA